MAKLTKAVLTGNSAVTLPSATTTQKTIQIFDKPGTVSWTVPTGVTSLECLIVGGGGGGGQTIAGGGGAGGLIYINDYAVTAGQTLTITVGAGGAGAPGVASSGSYPGYGTGGGTQGGNSVLSGGTGGTYTAIGGGGGGSYNQTSNGATSGGSGGGAGATQSTGGAGTSGQGNAGGSGASSNVGGGGGGAGGAGGNAVNGTGGGAGGVGLAYSITGISTYYAGGGGGGARIPTSGTIGIGGNGGLGGGGRGNIRTGENGVDGLGGGGGGGGYDDSSQTGPSFGGGRGGHGTVIIRWGTKSTDASAAGSATYNTNTSALEFFNGSNWLTTDSRKSRITVENLQLYYDFSDNKCYPGTGTTVFDLSGNQWNGTLVNSPTYQGNSFRFVSANSTRISTAFKPSGNRSYFLWIKYNSLTGVNGYSLTGTQESGAYTYIGIQDSADGIAGKGYFYSGTSTGGNFDYFFKTNKWYYMGFVLDASGYTTIYVNGVAIQTYSGTIGNTATNEFSVGCINTNHYNNANIAGVQVWNKPLTDREVRDNFNADCERFGIRKIDNSTNPDGTYGRPFGSPQQAEDLGYPRGLYWFKSGTMTYPRKLEFEPKYYEGRPWVTVFRSAYRKNATVNELDYNIPMAGLLVQKDVLNTRAAVYWSTPIRYNTVGSSGDNTADSGYSPRRVILGGAGGHGIYRTDQSQCNWGNSSGAIGAGWDGSTCGGFPNDLVWGNGDTAGSATYTNREGVWSHRVYWTGNNTY